MKYSLGEMSAYTILLSVGSIPGKATFKLSAYVMLLYTCTIPGPHLCPAAIFCYITITMIPYISRMQMCCPRFGLFLLLLSPINFVESLKYIVEGVTLLVTVDRL